MAITLQTIESLPLVEEVNENTSLVGWDGEKTVRVGSDMVGGSGLPEGGEPYKQLVTDAESNTVWEDREFYHITETVQDGFSISTRSAGGSSGLNNGKTKHLPFTLYHVGQLLSIEYANVQAKEQVVCECVVQQAPIGENIRYIGNGSLRNRLPTSVPVSMYGERWPDNVPDSGESFLMVFSDTSLDGSGNNVWLFAVNNKTVDEYDFTIKADIVSCVKPLPLEYIPRIVFTRDADMNYACNVPYEEFETAVMSGVPMVFIDTLRKSSSTNVSVCKYSERESWSVSAYDTYSEDNVYFTYAPTFIGEV